MQSQQPHLPKGEITEVIDLNWLLTGKSSPEGISIEPQYEGVTLLAACRTGNLPVMALLLLAGHGTQVNGKQNCKASVLHWAAYYGQCDLISYLLRHVDVNSYDSEGIGPLIAQSSSCSGARQTPLMCAVAGNHTDAVQLLLQLGAAIDAVDAGGHPVTFYGMQYPLMLHFLHVRGADLHRCADDGSSVLHWVAAKGHYMSAVYLFEKGNLKDPNVVDHQRRTALHVAASGSSLDIIRLLVANGVDPCLKDDRGRTAQECAIDAGIAGLLRQLEEEARIGDVRRSHLVQNRVQVAELPTGWTTWLLFTVAFVIPNAALAFASTLPGLLGILVLLGASYGVILISQISAERDSRDLTTTGWYMGALASGSAIVIFKVWPAILHGTDQHVLAAVWAFITLSMVCCYFRVLLGDPGIVQSTSESREALYTLAAAGKVPDNSEFCVDLMVRKPNRSKYDKVTHRCIARFDHYCVWLGNSVGAKNHLYFLLFCLCQFFSQLFVFYWAIKFLWASGGKPTHFGSFCAVADFFFWEDNALVTFFLLTYNGLAFLFVSTILWVQVRCASYNLTSNEVWFSRRYPWIILLGKEVVSLYDAGFWTNWKEFCMGRMHEDEFTPPPMNAHVKARVARYQAFLQRRGDPVPNPVFQQAQSTGQRCCHHHQQPQHAAGHGHGHGPENTAIQAAGGGQCSGQVCFGAHGLPPGVHIPMSPMSGPAPDAEPPSDVQETAKRIFLANLAGDFTAAGTQHPAAQFQLAQQQFMKYFATLPPEQQEAAITQSAERIARMRADVPPQGPAKSPTADAADRKRE
eukprot:GGOE01018446.1.p1 GENE.GGOE01018446.1~~GGOE01018446.1.p1  ORF type:complete len:803 (+),score=191.94 GGOE01018446.1:53-2461(+)